MMKFLVHSVIALCMFIGLSVSSPANAEGNVCSNANIFSNIISDVCWSCFLPVRLMGVGDKPDGAASDQPFCACDDALGIPEFGYQLGYWQPSRLIEHVRTPWCAPALGGVRLQDSLTGLSTGIGSEPKTKNPPMATFQYHYYAYPLFAMLEILYLPSCGGEYTDFDLMYLSEIDPTWNNDLLAILLSPEAFIFANPIAKAWCAADCGMISAGIYKEGTYGCAGCDGSLYPFTGNVIDGESGPRVTSLLSQRVLASLHRKGLARKTIGDEAMCHPEFWPMIPKSQYKLSMLFPVPEADSPNTESGSAYSRDCCHPLGQSEHVWSTAAGGRTIPGKEDYVYLLWRFNDCCILTTGIDAPGG
ncbi:MAG: TraU family protein [Pseudoalteromonas prydzensis]|uniref:TraU family protein n=1 Tax=Pseudoalteromonas prydzensis TaxID=182141 RepID=UPI003F993997